ncbi:putative benzoate 4-monooxygenase cytochrome P450 [Annulohypoxylon nitens]|nr:putative benzoate 4-monooxygenase cytochrome P450 [Annulohypoxylon nitens]
MSEKSTETYVMDLTFQFCIFLLLTFTTISFYLLRSWHRLNDIPGPFWAKFTNLQRLSWVRSKEAHLVYYDLHKKYGDMVRMGPNMVSISNPTAIPIIYPMRAGIAKSDFYTALRPYSRNAGPQQSIFNTQDEQVLKSLKKPIAPIFSHSNVVKFEPLVEEVLKCIAKQFDVHFVKTGESFNIGDWLQYFAFDVMGTMTFSKRYGFLDEGRDVDDKLKTIFRFMETAAPMTQIPWLDKWVYKNRFVDIFRRTPGLSILTYVARIIKERRDIIANSEKNREHDTYDFEGQPRQDFLSQYIEIQEKNAGVPLWAPQAWVFTNVVAGSDSVGTVMRTTLYHLLLNRETLDKLYGELKTANLSKPYPKWGEIRNLQYLDACVQEALRIHPSFALPFERTVPAGGLTVLGKYIPAGTIIGSNPYVNNRHKPTFGQDAESWRPERWIEGGSEHKMELEQSMITFGAGRRVCLGRHIGIFEVKKFISFLIMTYNIQVDKPQLFTVENIWVLKQSGFYACIEHR